MLHGVSGQLHFVPSIHCVGDWAGFRTGLDDRENRDILNTGSSVVVAFGQYFIAECATCFGLRTQHLEAEAKKCT